MNSCGVPAIIGVIRFVSTGQRDDRAVMQIVIPERVEIVAAFAARPNQFRFLRFVLRDQNDRALAGGGARRPADRADDVFARMIDDALRGIETKAVEMKFIDPVAAVGDEKLAHRSGVRSVEIDRIAPIVLVSVGKIIVGKNPQIISVRAEVVVNDVENDAQA